MEDEQVPQPLKKPFFAIPDEVLGEALRKNRGLQYLAAEAIGMNAGQFSRRVAQSPYLQMMRDDAREKRIDIAELSLTELTEEKNLGAVCFLLKTIGKSRGYIETAEVVVSPEVLKNHAELMQQLADFQASRRIEHKSQITEENS